MRYVKTSLTKLKSKVEDKFPEGNDIFDYPGINKTLIKETVEQIYTFASLIEAENCENRFEIIFLKRQSSAITKVLNDIIDSDTPQKEFDNFLTKLAELLWATKHTFFVINQNGLHTEEEIAKLNAQIKSLQAANAELEKIKDDYENAFDDFQDKIDTVSNFTNDLKAKQSTLDKQVKEIQEKHDDITTIHENINGWDVEIENRKTEMISLTNEIQTLKNSSDNLVKGLKENIESSVKNQTTLVSQQEKNGELLNEIEETLAGANKKGMAASFKEREDELNKSLLIWGIVFCSTIVGLVVVSVGWVIPEIKTEIEWLKLSARITVAAPLIWLAWFSAKQYLLVSKIKEDYAFKYASAMAYEGHKKAARELGDENLEKALLEMSLLNMEQNPIRLFSKTGYATPINELMDTVKRIKGKATQSGIEVEADLNHSQDK